MIVASSSRWDEGYAKVFSATAPNRALDVDLPNFSAEENRGRHLFMAGADKGGAGCSSCHLPPTFALAADARSNGLDAGETRVFKAPSLRNVALTGPYMHDGRFDTLAQVVAFYDQGVQDGPALDHQDGHRGRQALDQRGGPARRLDGQCPCLRRRRHAPGGARGSRSVNLDGHDEISPNPEGR